MSVNTNTVSLFSETLEVSVSESGKGRSFLLLHGGAGPGSMAGLAAALGQKGQSIVPTHPGFNGAPRPDWFTKVSDIALAYLVLIEKLNISKVVLVGNSMGGWIAAEMALRHSPRISGMVLLNAVGIDTGSPDKKIMDPMSVPPAERSAFSFHNPAKFAAPPSPEQLAIMVENQKALRVYAGEPFSYDPALRARLGHIAIPAVIGWGQSDRIVDADYGRLFAKSIPGAVYHAISEAGHFPQIERPEEVLALIGDLAARV